MVVTAEIFHAAADLIAQPGGWCRDTFARDVRGRRLPGLLICEGVSYCAEGALMRVLGAFTYKNPAFVEAAAIVMAATGVADLAQWNDHRRRTKDDVVALLRQCADYLAAQQLALAA